MTAKATTVPKVTWSAEPWVRFEICGKYRGPGMTKDDGGIGHEFLKYVNTLDLRVRWQTTGGGHYVGLFHPEDWPKVEAWLTARNLTRVPGA